MLKHVNDFRRTRDPISSLPSTDTHFVLSVVQEQRSDQDEIERCQIGGKSVFHCAVAVEFPPKDLRVNTVDRVETVGQYGGGVARRAEEWDGMGWDWGEGRDRKTGGERNGRHYDRVPDIPRIVYYYRINYRLLGSTNSDLSSIPISAFANLIVKSVFCAKNFELELIEIERRLEMLDDINESPWTIKAA
ncbi:hypothetical protein V1478_006969 [Vespula squamosa]|uniref:Uncharacterized protein n=1 Tax=Vespula squamosa TaxID=30214 RepID=A0ABD2B1W4_VESSQ